MRKESSASAMVSYSWSHLVVSFIHLLWGHFRNGKVIGSKRKHFEKFKVNYINLKRAKRSVVLQVPNS
jgi:hypothetical protein